MDLYTHTQTHTHINTYTFLNYNFFSIYLIFFIPSHIKVKVALLSITLHVKTYKGIEKNVSHSPTVKHIKCTRTTTDKTRHVLHIDIVVSDYNYREVPGNVEVETADCRVFQ